MRLNIKFKKRIIIVVGLISLFVCITVSSITIYIFRNIAKKSTEEEEVEEEQVSITNKIIFYKDMTDLLDERAGIWEYDLLSGEDKQLLSFTQFSVGKTTDQEDFLELYARKPIISNKKDKFVFMPAWMNSEESQRLSYESNYDMYFYDLRSGSSQLITSDLNVNNGYTDPPIWAEDDNSLYIVLEEGEINEPLYEIYLDGKMEKFENLGSDVFYPRLHEGNIVFIGDGYLRFYNPTTKKLSSFTPNFSSGSHLYQESPYKIISAQKGSLRETRPIYREKIYGVDVLNTQEDRVEFYPIPESITFTPETKRIQSAILCDKYLLLGRVIPDDSSEALEAYSEMWVYDLESKRITVSFENPDPNNESHYCENEYELIYWGGDYWSNTCYRYEVDLNRKEHSTFKYCPSIVNKDLDDDCYHAEVRYKDDTYRIIEILERTFYKDDPIIPTCQERWNLKKDVSGLYLFDKEKGSDYIQIHENINDEESNIVLAVFPD